MKIKTIYKSRNSNVLRKPCDKRNHIIRRNSENNIEEKEVQMKLEKMTVKYRKTIEWYTQIEKFTYSTIKKFENKLLVARNIKLHQKIYSRMLKMSTEQSTTHKEDRRTSSIRNTSRTMVKYQY